MKITQIEIYKSPVRLNEPFIISLGQHDYAENVIVIIRTDKGISGFGECSPFITIHGENMDTAFVMGQLLAKGLLEKKLVDPEKSSDAMDAMLFGNTSIKSAFDIALHDIAAQEAQQPLYIFLGGRKNRTLITDYTISIDEPSTMASRAKKIKADGFQVIKVKLGGKAEHDIERIRQIRNAIGNDMPLRIDANQGWSADDAIQILGALAPFHIQHCEEPIARENFMELAHVRKQSPIPIMADESCCDHYDAERLAALSSCDFINVKLGKSSGFIKAKKIIAVAEKAGIKMQVGGFLESRLGFTAAAHLALVSDEIVYIDFDTPLMQSEDHVTGGIQYGPGGSITVPEQPGLGAAIDPNYLERLEKIIVKL